MARTETHNHHSGHSHHDLRHASQRSLLIALGLTVSFMIVEIVGALIGGSLALPADGVHMIGDVSS